MSSIRGRGKRSGTVTELRRWSSITQRGGADRSDSDFAIRKEGEAKGEEEGQMRPALVCSSTSVCHAVRHLQGHEYSRDMQIFSAVVTVMRW